LEEKKRRGEGGLRGKANVEAKDEMEKVTRQILIVRVVRVVPKRRFVGETASTETKEK
jgi:hypothetical protein